MDDFLTANYHAHTWRCKHASGTEREYIEAAILQGIRVFGFSDHIPCPFRNGFVSGIRMDMEQAQEYADTVRRLGEEYKDRIRILLGFEAEYIPDFFEEQIRMAHDIGCDYLIMGQHFLESEQYGPYTGIPTRDESRIRRYVDLVIEGMRTGSFSYLAHPDLMNYQGLGSVYDWEMTRLCKELKALEIPLEINILGKSEGKHYPADRFWRIAGEVGNPVILGLDAHGVRNILDRKSYEECMELARRHRLNLIDRVDLKRP